MRVDLTEQFIAQYDEAELRIQKAVQKQLGLLKNNVRHPSLHAKKYDEARDIWQARITRDWRFYFSIKGDIYQIIEMKAHPK